MRKQVTYKLTFYSGKLWHSDKPAPVLNAIADPDMKDLKVWLSTAYEVVNPEVIGCTIIEMKRTKFFYGPPENGKQKQLSDGDELTLPEGYGIKERKYRQRGEVNGPERREATITLPEKPENTDKIFIDGDFNDSYESRVRRAKVKKIEGLGNEKFDVHQVDSQNVEFVEKVDSVQWQDIMTTAAGVEPSESQEEMWKEVVDKISKTVESYVNEFIDSSSEQMRDDLRADLEELNGKFTITRK